MALAIAYSALAIFAALKPRYIIYLLILASPFYEYFPVIFIKIKILGIGFTLKPFLLITILLIAVSLKKFVSSERLSVLRFELLHKLIFVSLSLFCLISLYFSLVEKSLYLTEINMALNIGLIFLIPFYYWKKEISLRGLLNAFAVMVLIVSFYSIISDIFFIPSGDFRFDRHPGFCTFLLMTMPLVILSFFIAKSRAASLLNLAALVISFNTIIFSFTRSGYVALLVTLPFFMLYCFFTAPAKRTIFVKSVVLFAVFIASFIVGFQSSYGVRGATSFPRSIVVDDPNNVYKDPVVAKIKNHYLRNTYSILAHERTIVWRKAIQVFMSAPFKGHGLNYHLVPGLYGVHNNLLAVLVASGLIGFFLFAAAFVMFFAFLIKAMKRSSEWPKKIFFFAILISAISLFIQGLVQTVINEYVIWLIIALAFLDPAYIKLEK